MGVVVAVAYWRDDGYYPRSSGSRRRGDVYLRNTATMAATWQRVSTVSDTRVRLCSNVVPTGDVGAQLQALGVEVESVPFRSVPPGGYFDRFSAATYSLDVLHHHARELADDDVLVLVDPDVVWARDPAPLVAQVHAEGLVGHAIPRPPDVRDLGLTRRELGTLIGELAGREVREAPPLLGGELLAVTGAQLPAFAAACTEGWQASVARFDAGDRPLLHTEEHVYSYAFEVLGRGVHDTPHLIRRVWTRPGTVRNVTGHEDAVLAWHVLTEKTHGLWRLYDDLQSGRGPFAAEDEREYRRRLARRLAIDPGPATRTRLAVGTGARLLAGRRIRPMDG